MTTTANDAARRLRINIITAARRIRRQPYVATLCQTDSEGNRRSMVVWYGIIVTYHTVNRDCMLTGFLFRNTGRAVKTICNLARFLNLDMDFLDPTVGIVWYGMVW